jgi:hypothetical protein
MELTCVGAWSNVLVLYREEGDSAIQKMDGTRKRIGLRLAI